MAKRFRNKWGWYGVLIYLGAVLLFGLFSVGEAFLAASAINGLFLTLVLPTVAIILGVNFFVGYGLGLIAENIWRKFK